MRRAKKKRDEEVQRRNIRGKKKRETERKAGKVERNRLDEISRSVICKNSRAKEGERDRAEEVLSAKLILE